MHLSRRDMIATVLVVVGAGVALAWMADAALPGLGSVRVTALVVMLLGFLASASAVVPAFVELLHGSRAYLVVTSALGVLALVGGVLAVATASTLGLTLLLAPMVALWLISTAHHDRLAHPVPEPVG
jgi:hypothetical protein